MRGGSKVIIRPLEERDLDRLVEWDSDPEIAYLMGGPARPADESREWYTMLMHARNSVPLAIETQGGELIGDAQLLEISYRSGDAELVVRIGSRDYWGNGYGTDAVMEVLRIAFHEMNLNRVYLRVCRHNPRAIRCYEKCGFRREGIIRRRATEGCAARFIVLMTIVRDEFESGKAC